MQIFGTLPSRLMIRSQTKYCITTQSRRRVIIRRYLRAAWGRALFQSLCVISLNLRRMQMTKDTGPKINVWRAISSFIFLFIGAALIYWRRSSLFYLEPSPTSGSPFQLFNVDRLIWCFSCSCLGFSFLVFQLWRHQKSIWPTYLTYYPVLLILISCLVFSIFHTFEQTSGFNFYYISFTLCFILSFLVDHFWKIITDLIEKVSK